jgi:hypothetical protein
MSAVGHLIGGAFAGGAAPFAVHPNDRTRAAQYLEEALKAQVTWAEAEQDIRSYLGGQGVTDPGFIQGEVDRARPLLEPWLS